MEETPPATTPATTPEPRRGALASALTPITPARPIATSTSHHPSETPIATSDGQTATTNRQNGDSIPRALLMALAERWRQGPSLAQKRLDVEREKAKGLQVKENRTTQATTQAIDKNETRRLGETKTNRQDQNQRKADGKNHTNRDNRSNDNSTRQDRTDQKNETRRHGETKKNNQDQRKTDSKDHKARDHKGNDTSETRNRRDSKNDAKNHRGDDHKTTRQARHDRKDDTKNDRRDHRDNRPPGSTTQQDRSDDHKTTKQGHATKPHRDGDTRGSRSVLNLLKKKDPNHAAKADKHTNTEPPTKTTSTKTDKDTTPGTDKTTSQEKTPTLSKTPHAETPTPDEKPDTKKPTSTTSTPTASTPTTDPRTRPAREAGYRDGHRAGRITEHAKAYRDGVRDGYTDAAKQGAQEKKILDDARNRQHPPAAQENPVPPNPATTPATPIEVTNVTADGVHLGAGADRLYMTRGEVRNLKSYERRLTARSLQLDKIAERARGLHEHANAQAAKALNLLEATRAVDGGESLLPSLQRLAEHANAQAGKADQIHTRAVRGAEEARLVLANVKRRDGAIYQAVLDSPETRPAEVAFYKDTDAS